MPELDDRSGVRLTSAKNPNSGNQTWPLAGLQPVQLKRIRIDWPARATTVSGTCPTHHVTSRVCSAPLRTIQCSNTSTSVAMATEATVPRLREAQIGPLCEVCECSP